MSDPELKKTIQGGYYIKARKIGESAVAHASPCTREVWDYLLRHANHKNNGVAKRGQLVRTIADIQEALSWKVGYRKKTYTKNQIVNALEWLRKGSYEGTDEATAKQPMITTTKTTRGMVITICKYDYYNTPENYEGNSEDNTKQLRRQQQGDTINKNEEECKKEEEENARELKTEIPETPKGGAIVPAMVECFTKANKGYPVDRENDFPAVAQMVLKIHKWLDLPNRPEDDGNPEKIQRRWGELVGHIKADSHLRKYSLAQINKHFQSIAQSFSSGVKEVTPKKNKQDELAIRILGAT